MNRRKFFTRGLLIGGVVVLLAGLAWAFEHKQSNETNQTFSKAELDQMLAPIALYPDSLLAQVLLAATFPEQVVEADRWVKENEGLSGDQLNAALDKMDWDLSVKALVPFPQVLAMMDEHLDWTTKLGEAFLDQQSDVMASVQELRAKAYAKGNLKPSEQQKVVVAENDIEIEPADPEVVYVPYYNPVVVYGDWWWPEDPPYAYYPDGEPSITVGESDYLAPATVGPFWHSGWGSWNWRRRNVNVNTNRTVNINRNDPGITHHMRTANYHGVAKQWRAARFMGAGRTGVGGRPTETSVQRWLNRGHGGNAARGGGESRRTGNMAQGGGASHKTTNEERGGGQVSRGTFSREAISGGRGGGSVSSGRSGASPTQPQVNAAVPKPQLPPQVNAAVPKPQLPPQVHAAVPKPQLPPQLHAVAPKPQLPPQLHAVAPKLQLAPQVHAAAPRPQLPPQVHAVAPRPQLPPQVHAAAPRPQLPPKVQAAAPRPQLPSQAHPPAIPTL